MMRCCCGKYDVTQDEDFIVQDIQHQMYGKVQGYTAFCGPVLHHDNARLQAALSAAIRVSDTWERLHKELEKRVEVERSIKDAEKKILVEEVEKNAALRERLRLSEDAIKAAYRKHCMSDDSIGWDELGNILHNALCNLIGDEGYLGWVQAIRKAGEHEK